MVFVEKSGLKNVQVLDKSAGKKLLALAPGHLFTEMQRGEGAAPGSHGKLGLCTLVPVSFLEQALWELCPLSLPLLSPTGHICAAGPGVGVCAHLYLLGGESAPWASGWPYLGLSLGAHWWW